MRACCPGAPEMAEKRRLNLSFSMASQLQKEAWKILSAVPYGQRTDAVCRAICKPHNENTLLESIRNIIKEELKNVEFTVKNEQPRAGDVDENVLGFLLALQNNDGGEEKSDSLF